MKRIEHMSKQSEGERSSTPPLDLAKPTSEQSFLQYPYEARLVETTQYRESQNQIFSDLVVKKQRAESSRIVASIEVRDAAKRIDRNNRKNYDSNPDEFKQHLHECMRKGIEAINNIKKSIFENIRIMESLGGNVVSDQQLTEMTEYICLNYDSKRAYRNVRDLMQKTKQRHEEEHLQHDINLILHQAIEERRIGYTGTDRDNIVKLSKEEQQQRLSEKELEVQSHLTSKNYVLREGNQKAYDAYIEAIKTLVTLRYCLEREINSDNLHPVDTDWYNTAKDQNNRSKQLSKRGNELLSKRDEPGEKEKEAKNLFENIRRSQEECKVKIGEVSTWQELEQKIEKYEIALNSQKKANGDYRNAEDEMSSISQNLKDAISKELKELDDKIKYFRDIYDECKKNEKEANNHACNSQDTIDQRKKVKNELSRLKVKKSDEAKQELRESKKLDLLKQKIQKLNEVVSLQEKKDTLEADLLTLRTQEQKRTNLEIELARLNSELNDARAVKEALDRNYSSIENYSFRQYLIDYRNIDTIDGLGNKISIIDSITENRDHKTDDLAKGHNEVNMLTNISLNIYEGFLSESEDNLEAAKDIISTYSLGGDFDDKIQRARDDVYRFTSEEITNITVGAGAKETFELTNMRQTKNQSMEKAYSNMSSASGYHVKARYAREYVSLAIDEYMVTKKLVDSTKLLISLTLSKHNYDANTLLDAEMVKNGIFSARMVEDGIFDVDMANDIDVDRYKDKMMSKIRFENEGINDLIAKIGNVEEKLKGIPSKIEIVERRKLLLNDISLIDAKFGIMKINDRALQTARKDRDKAQEECNIQDSLTKEIQRSIDQTNAEIETKTATIRSFKMQEELETNYDQSCRDREEYSKKAQKADIMLKRIIHEKDRIASKIGQPLS